MWHHVTPVIKYHDASNAQRALSRMLLLLVMLRPLLSMWPGSVGTGSSSTVTSLRSRTRRSYAERRFGSSDKATCDCFREQIDHTQCCYLPGKLTPEPSVC